MLSTSQASIKVRKPINLIEREIKADFQVIAKAITCGSLDALKGDWSSAVKEWGTGVIEGLGLKPNTPQEIAWKLILSTLRQSVLTLVEDNYSLLKPSSDIPNAFPDELKIVFNDADIRIGPNFFQEAWKLPVLKEIQKPFANWLASFAGPTRNYSNNISQNNDEKKSIHEIASEISAQLPQRFGNLLWIEFGVHRDKYKALEDILLTPIQCPPDFIKLRSAYYKYLHDSYEYLDLKGLPGVVQALEKASGLELRQVYVSILGRSDRSLWETWDRKNQRRIDAPEEPVQFRRAIGRGKPVPLELAVTYHPAIVILGDPGAGKSTLLKHLCLNFVNQESLAFPILVPLNAYAEALKLKEQPLRRFLPKYFATRRQELEGIESLFEHAIENGQAIILLDGLDEVRGERAALARRVEDFVREIIPAPNADPDKTDIVPGNRVVVTSRFVGYNESPLLDQRWLTLAVVDWDREEIIKFAEKWTYAVELATSAGHRGPYVDEQASKEKNDLLLAIFSKPHITQLAGNPLLLTILALIKRQGVTLPYRRVELYELYIRTLLDSWHKARSLDKQPVGPDIEFHSIWHVLAALGLWIRETSPQHGLVAQQQIRDYLVQYFKAEGYGLKQANEEATSFLKSVHTYSSLLVQRGPGEYGFLHQTFGEYLAGCGLTEDNDAESKLLKYLGDPAWHEAILLGIGALGIVRKDRKRASELLLSILNADTSNITKGENTLLSGEALLDIGLGGLTNYACSQIKENLINTMHNVSVGFRRQRKAGDLLGKLNWRPNDLDFFREINTNLMAFHNCRYTKSDVPSLYWMAQYPVTNAQYSEFIDEKGYHRPELWSDNGWSWRIAINRIEPTNWKDEEFNNPIFPVVFVSWYEAEAYCNWLQLKLFENRFETPNGKMKIPQGYIVRMPKEYEWMVGACGTDGQKYPSMERNTEFIGNSPIRNGGVHTTAVCTYPKGVSSLGIWDTFGNMSEWTLSGFAGDNCVFFIKGGAWENNEYGQGCFYRIGMIPNTIERNIGIRVVISPNK